MLHKSFRLIALICAFSIGVSQPIPAFALRSLQDQEGRQKVLAGIEESVAKPKAAPTIWWAGDLPMVPAISGDPRPLLVSLDIHAPDLARNELRSSLELRLFVQGNGQQWEFPVEPQQMQLGEGWYGLYHNNYRIQSELPAEVRVNLETAEHVRFWFKYRLKGEADWKDTSEGNKQNGVGEIVHQPNWLFNSAMYTLNAKAWGSFESIEKRLPELQQLGAKILLLQGIHPGHTAFEIDDYETADPALGGEQGLRSLLQEAKKRGFRVVIPFVPGHSSPKNKLLQESPHLYKKASAESPALETVAVDVKGVKEIFLRGNVYLHGALPGEIPGGFGPGTVQFDLWDPANREELAAYWGKVLGQWARFGIDGFYADTGHSIHRVAPGWLEEIQRRIRSEHPDTVFGFEAHWFEAGGFVARGGSFAQEFALYYDWFREILYGRKDAAGLTRHLQQMPTWFLQSQLTFYQNHDEDPLDLHLEWSPVAPALKADAHRAYAALLLLGVPGIPLMTSGQESGLKERWNGTGHPWAYDNQWDWGRDPNAPQAPLFDPFSNTSPEARQMRQAYSDLLRIRQANPAFWWADGTRFLPTSDPRTFAAYRAAGNRRALVLIRLDTSARDPEQANPVVVDLSALKLSPLEAASLRESLKKPSLVLPASDSLGWNADEKKENVTFLSVRLKPFQAAVLEFSLPVGTAAGLEETYFPPPRKVDSPPAEKILEAGSDVLPSDDERLARMAFEAPRGGPRQHLRLFASLNITLPAALRDERYGGKTLLSYLPDGATLNSGYINAIEEPFIRSRIRRLLADQGPRVRARVHLDRGDVEIPMSPINVWADGKIRYEGRVPAEDIRFHVDRSFTVEVYWNGQWHRLREEGRIRIEPPNPSQIAALSGPDDLGMGQHDAQEELRYARGLLAEPGDEETKKANEALLNAGIVTNQNLPAGQRAPYLGKLQSDGRISPAEARKAFVAQQRAARVQKDEFFEGMQFRLGVSPSGDRWLLMYNPNRANTPKPMPGAAHPLSEEGPVQFKELTGEVVTLRQRMLPVPTDRLDNPVKAKVNPYGYVWGHLTLPVTTQIAQSDWPEAIDAVVEQMWQQQSRLTVIGVNLGGKAAASLPDWAHAHDIPWRMPVDEVGDSEILWRSEDQGVRLGLLRDPFLTTFVFEGDQGSSVALVAQAKSLVARLKDEGFGDYNAWGVVRPDGIGRLFVLPRNPVEPDPPTDAAEKKWKPADDYAKPIADQDYWLVELSPGQRRLMSRFEMEQAGIPTAKPPLVLKGRPVLDIKMGIMELRRFFLISQLAIYEDPDLEARLIKTYELVGVPWSDPRARQILEGIPAVAEQLDEDSERQVHRLTEEMGGIGSADRLVALFDAVSEWRHRHVDAFDRLAGLERSAFTAAAERQIKRWVSPDGLIREVSHAQGSVPTPDATIPPILAVALNPTLDRGVRVVESDGRNFLEVSMSAGGPGANLVQAASSLGREAHLMGLFSGETGGLAIEALHDYGVAVHPIVSSESQPDTRSSLMVASSRPGRRERRLVGEGATTPAGLIQQVRLLLESELWRDRRYSLVVGERWVGDSAPEVAREAADLIRFARGKGNEVHVTMNRNWTSEIWETMLASSPSTVSSSLEALAEFPGQLGQVDRWRHRSEEAAQAADTLRRKFGIGEWLVHLGAAGTVLVTDEGWRHVVPSPVLRLTYLSGSTDVVDAAYLLYRSKKQVPVDALAAGITASLLFMETNGIVPRDEEIRNHLFRVQANVLPRPISALGGLEEQTARTLDLLAEARTGRGIVVIHASAFDQFSGLEEFLGRLASSRELSSSFVVWGGGDAVDRVRGVNPFVRIFKSDSSAEFSNYLAGLEEAESVGVLGVTGTVRPLAVLLSSRGIPARIIGWNLLELLSTIGFQQDVLTQGGLEELQADLFRVRGT